MIFGRKKESNDCCNVEIVEAKDAEACCDEEQKKEEACCPPGCC